MEDFWTKRYAPKSTSELKGQDKAINELKAFVVGFEQQTKKGALLYGPPGCGKTASVIALANELNLELVELNASDFRNSAAIESIVGSASKQRSLFHAGKIILVDEIDGLAGREDRGGLQTLMKLLKSTAFPIVLTANDPWEQRFSTLRRQCRLIQFHKLNYKTVVQVLKGICKSEGISYEEVAIDGLARRVDGDLRAGIIDLFLLTSANKHLSTKELEFLFDRKRELPILEAITRILKTRDIEVALGALNDVSEDLDEVMLWLDENMPLEYKKPEELAKAYESLSKADVFRGRISRWQYWRFLVYMNALLTVGVALAKEEKYRGYTKFQRGRRILNMWIWNRKNMLKKSIASKLAAHTHCSTAYAFQEVVDFLRVMYSNSEWASKLEEELELDEKEIEWLKERRIKV